MLNSQLVEQEQAKIPAGDHGFLYGVGLFETFRVYNSIPFLFSEHLERLEKGLALLHIKHDQILDQMSADLNRLLVANKLTDAYVRVTVTAGVQPLGLPNKDYESPNILWQIKSLSPFSKIISDEKNAVFLKTTRNFPETEVRLKSLNFLNNVIAKQEIISQQNTEGFFLTNAGYIAEGLVSNIFFVKDGQVCTPSLETGILNGITRQQIINLCLLNKIPIKEGLFTKEQLLNADGLFITNSIQEVVPISRLEDQEYMSKENRLINFLAMSYKDSIRKECKIGSENDET